MNAYSNYHDLFIAMLDDYSGRIIVMLSDPSQTPLVMNVFQYISTITETIIQKNPVKSQNMKEYCSIYMQRMNKSGIQFIWLAHRDAWRRQFETTSTTIWWSHFRYRMFLIKRTPTELVINQEMWCSNVQPAPYLI